MTIGTLAGAVLLLVAGALDSLDRPRLAATLARQRLLGPRGRRVVGAALGPAQLAVGVVVLALWVGGAPGFRESCAVPTALYAGFAAYLLVLVRRRPGAPCGCLGGDTPAGVQAIGRAALFAACSAGSAMNWPPAAGATAIDMPAPDRLILLAAAGLLAAIAALLPTVLTDQARDGEAARRSKGRHQRHG